MNFNRQAGLFNPEDIKDKSVTVVGAGATGSHVAMWLAQMGWGGNGNGILKVCDYDSIEEHNIPNQCFDKSQIGMKKVDALKDNIFRRCGFNIEGHDVKIVDQKDIMQSNYVFLLTDTMSSRKEIFENCLKHSFDTDLVIETRMGLKGGRVYAFNPNDGYQRDLWEKSLYTDEEAEVSACGTSMTILSTTIFTASLAVNRLIQHFNVNSEKPTIEEDGMWNELHFGLYPEYLYALKWEKGQEPKTFSIYE